MEEPLEDRTNARRTAILAVLVLALVAALLFLRPAIERASLMRASESVSAALRLTAQGLNDAVRRYEPLPSLISDLPELRRLLGEPMNDSLLRTVNEQLRHIAQRLDASDVYLMDVSGLTIASSNHFKENSFLGKRFAYRPYFTQALSDGTGRFHALGTTSGERGVFFAASVRDRDMVLGVVAVKFTVGAFEEAWQASGQDVLVSDRNGVVFMASRPDWLFRTLAPLSQEVRDAIAATRQYPLERVQPLGQTQDALGGSVSRWEVAGEGFVGLSEALHGHDFTIHVLASSVPARTQSWAALGILALGLALAGLLVTVVLMRRARILERLESQRLRENMLEARVAERTRDLSREIDERKAAEARLRATQSQLVQAGKLAALGQMSAALSHEINQPLAAVKSYAENAATYLDRKREVEARENISRISEMADRMAAISGHLRNFARRPQEDLGPIRADAVSDDALALMDAKIRQAGAQVAVTRPDRPVWVIAGRVRLQQVIVNLLTNALDAMDAAVMPQVGVHLNEDAGNVRISIRDHGPGLPDPLLEHVFDPFFTTKGPGKGLGLGLSISFNIVEDFGGRLLACNLAEGGAEFTVMLQASQSPGHGGEMAAE
ncbi:MAG: ATP-binding protein [Pseudomonadota bacterium]